MFELTIKTERLFLRPFKASDAMRVQELAGAREIAIMTASIPHPYPDGAAEAWIAMNTQRRHEGKSFAFAIDIDGLLAGSIGIEDAGRGVHLELGYWLGLPYWGHGYTSEAAVAVTEFGFVWLNQPALIAGYAVDNPASGRILEKLGFTKTHVKTVPHAVRGCDVDIIRLELTKDAWAAKRV